MTVVRGPFQIAKGRQEGEIETLWVNSLIKGGGRERDWVLLFYVSLPSPALSLIPSLYPVFYYFN